MWEKIRAARKDAGVTQEAVADACEISRNAVSLWESSDPRRRTKPKYNNLRILARLTRKPQAYFLDGDEGLDIIIERLEQIYSKGGRTREGLIKSVSESIERFEEEGL